MTPEPGGSGECLINFQLHPDSLLVQKTGCRVLLSSSPKDVPQKTGVLLECPNNPSVGSLGLLAMTIQAFLPGACPKAAHACVLSCFSHV